MTSPITPKDDELIERPHAMPIVCDNCGAVVAAFGDGTMCCHCMTAAWRVDDEALAAASRIAELKAALSDTAIALEGWHRLNFVDDIQAEVLRRAKSALSNPPSGEVS